MNENTIVYRQIHPSFVQGGFPTSQAFRPTPKDQSQLSVYDGDLISSEKAWVHYTVELGHASGGVMGLSVAECAAESHAVRSAPEPFPEHAVIDFAELTDKECRNRSKKLQCKAVERGWLYRAS